MWILEYLGIAFVAGFGSAFIGDALVKAVLGGDTRRVIGSFAALILFIVAVGAMVFVPWLTIVGLVVVVAVVLDARRAERRRAARRTFERLGE